MSGSMRKIGEYLGLLEDTGRYDDYETFEGDDQQTGVVDRVRDRDSEARRPAPVADLDKRRRAQGRPAVAEQTPLVSRITTVSPRSYNDAAGVGEHFREGVPVIMNLVEMDDADAKRVVDFAAGLVFATRGNIERVANKVFLLSPPGVSISTEHTEQLAGVGFYNQS